ncbi:probable F420-dependent oxidoreductase, Rv1855c family [Sanguibacter gelidistatuariae]|uniref:Probable F420-dependent oxidoreductase, Rv1855c family n=1 Tax=Sanguibacter gelidistatuariae TaxID=1814289 RepID=A0A1G6KGQ4_9MICO|nr:LLM class F420-dependent oxidoreductase [Sanguibacter gelidistatuariae]SDC30282.1 probable F420-dependent oxidoreductase, Rv1855c family [Sanguibacter gelidistatuariae]
MRFGLFIPQGWRQDLTGIAPAAHWTTMNGLAQHADTGTVFDSVWVYDHFHTVPEPTTEATHEAWSLMAAFAASTSRVKLGQMCTCMAYRNPAYLAKAATTVDIISGGRAQMGIGAGWYEEEWRAYGYGFPRAGERLDALDEGVQIMKQMWTQGSATFAGKHFQVDGALNYPLPLQDGGLPLWIAGGGEKKTLRIAAQHADFTNFDGAPEVFAHKSAILAKHCAEQGRDFADITRSANYNVVIGETEKDVADRLAWIGEHYAKTVPAKAASTVEDLRSGPLVGTPEQIVETLTGLKALGMTYAITYFAEAAYDRSGIELFESQVAPALA